MNNESLDLINTPETQPLPETNDGATLTLNTAETSPVETPAEQQKKLTVEQFLVLLRDMLASEKITPRQALELRRQFGIPNNYFTKKKIDKIKRKRKRAIANASRRRNRYNANAKGQKRNNGHFLSSSR